MNIKSFEDAFHCGTGSCSRMCECGRIFYNHTFDDGWDWEEGELDELEKNPKAENRDWSISSVIIEGTEYCIDCDCWHERAKTIMRFLDNYRRQIGEYFKHEKNRLNEKAESYPTI